MKTIKQLLLTLIITVSSLFAQKIGGLQIIQNVYDRPTGNDQTADLTMTLINSRGNKRVREMKQYLKDYGEVEKKTMFFVAPADVYNTSFMNWSYDQDGKNDDQWIYLPALKRVKRISSDSKSDYFMGSDFTYDDLGDRKPDQDSHKILRSEEFDGETCFVVQSIPKEEEYMYSKTITWVIKDKWIGKKKEFYDEDGELLKILSVEKSEVIKGYLLPTTTVMKNVQNDHKTIMHLGNIKIDTGVSDRKFTERSMRRGI